MIKLVHTSFSCPDKRKNVIWIPMRPYWGSTKDNKIKINFSAFRILTYLCFDSPTKTVLFTFLVLWLSNHKNNNKLFSDWQIGRMSVCPLSCFSASEELFLVKIQSQDNVRFCLSNIFLAEVLIGRRLNVELLRESEIETF